LKKKTKKTVVLAQVKSLHFHSNFEILPPQTSLAVIREKMGQAGQQRLAETSTRFRLDRVASSLEPFLFSIFPVKSIDKSD
jgi:hypothetical protein